MLRKGEKIFLYSTLNTEAAEIPKCSIAAYNDIISEQC